MEQSIWKHRRPLTHTYSKLQEGALTIGFIGGSITDGRPRHNWPEPVTAWFVSTFPHARISVENAAIGATGSDLAVFRAERDLINRGCDLVFIDYAVNDSGVPSERRKRSREGLIRKLLAGNEERDLVLVHTFMQAMYESMSAGEYPDSISELEELANHYDIGSIWMGLYALQDVNKGRMRWEEWLPDGLHPTERGSYSYGESVIAFLQEEKARVEQAVVNDSRADVAGGAKIAEEAVGLANPMNSLHWGEAVTFSLDEVRTEGPWTLRRWPYYEWIDRVLETAAVGAQLSFDFVGRGLALGFDFGKTSSEFRWRMDGGEWTAEVRERPDWVGNDGWFRLSFLGDDWEMGQHHFELEVLRGEGPGNNGSNFRLGLIGVIK
jgi:hypothetical protein